MTIAVDYRGALEDALKRRGSTPDGARKFVQEFHDKIVAAAREDSDHDAYRILADEIGKVIHTEADPDNYDGDDSELHILCEFVAWLPDMIRHNLCNKIRSHAVDGRYAADWADPFERTSGCRWVRKSDGVPVPWPVVTD